jgi:hypothetical protein
VEGDAGGLDDLEAMLRSRDAPKPAPAPVADGGKKKKKKKKAAAVPAALPPPPPPLAPSPAAPPVPGAPLELQPFHIDVLPEPAAKLSRRELAELERLRSLGLGDGASYPGCFAGVADGHCQMAMTMLQRRQRRLAAALCRGRARHTRPGLCSTSSRSALPAARPSASGAATLCLPLSRRVC